MFAIGKSGIGCVQTGVACYIDYERTRRLSEYIALLTRWRTAIWIGELHQTCYKLFQADLISFAVNKPIAACSNNLLYYCTYNYRSALDYSSVLPYGSALAYGSTLEYRSALTYSSALPYDSALEYRSARIITLYLLCLWNVVQDSTSPLRTHLAEKLWEFHLNRRTTSTHMKSTPFTP